MSWLKHAMDRYSWGRAENWTENTQLCSHAHWHDWICKARADSICKCHPGLSLRDLAFSTLIQSKFITSGST